jgi:hypothetical protein
MVLRVDLGTHVQKLVNDAKNAALRREVKRSAAILHGRTGDRVLAGLENELTGKCV